MSILSLKAEVESVDQVPEKYRPFYTENDGKYVLDEELVGDQKKYTSTSANLSKANKEAKERRTALEAWEALGLSPDEAKEKIAAGEKAPAGDPTKTQEEIDRVRTAITAKHQKEIEAERAKTNGYRGQLERSLIGSDAKSAIAAAKGIVPLLLPHVQSQMKLFEGDDGELVARVVDGKGEVRLNGHGNPMTVAELVDEMKGNADFKTAFLADTTTGGDKPNAGRQAPGGKAMKRSEMTIKEKSDYIGKHGQAAFMALPQ